MDWQPIETAPKDGTPILVYSAVLGPAPFAITWWALNLMSGRKSEVTRAPLVEDFWTNSKGAKIDGNPSHWMLLPLPPTS